MDYPDLVPFTIVPAGDYVATISGVRPRRTKMGDALWLDFRVSEGPHGGRVLADQHFFVTELDARRVNVVRQLLNALDHADRVDGEEAQRLVEAASASHRQVVITVDWEGYDHEMEPATSSDWRKKDKATLEGAALFKHENADGSRHALGIAGQRIKPTAVVVDVRRAQLTESPPATLDPALEKEQRLLSLGVRNYQSVVRTPRPARSPWIVKSLIRSRSVNGCIRGSGIGKTPLLKMRLMCNAAGIPFFGMETQQGPTLYCDAESPEEDQLPTMEALASHLGLPEPPPDYHEWIIHENPDLSEDLAGELFERVRELRPISIVVDPLRSVWPFVERNKNADVMKMMRALRGLCAEIGTSWDIVHHLRKDDRDSTHRVSLEDDPRAWLQDAAGSLAFINHLDARIGIDLGDRKGGVDLVLGGFLRGRGDIPVLKIARVYDDQGEPVGYRQVTGLDQLTTTQASAYSNLPKSFRFKDAKVEMGGNSDSNVNNFLLLCQRLQLLKREDGRYIKLVE